jgi:hypothetical protein
MVSAQVACITWGLSPGFSTVRAASSANCLSLTGWRAMMKSERTNRPPALICTMPS